jgi:hypothetical protein
MRKIFCALSGMLLLLCVVARADLHDPSNSADYLILSTDSLIQNSWINDLVTWRAAQGRTARSIAVEDIYSEFGSGLPSDSVLRDFLFYARANWQPPQLKDVFIVGWQDVVPAHVEADSQHVLDSTYQREDYLSDYFYAHDPDSAYPLPTLNIGRYPWSPADTFALIDYAAKVVGYETAPDGAWRQRVQVIADGVDGIFDFAHNFAEPIVARLEPHFVIERDYLDYPTGDPWHGDSAEVQSNLNAGSAYVFYLGHGGAGVWSSRELVTVLSAAGQTNGARLPIISSFCYDTGINGNWIMNGIARAMLGNPHGGGIGCLASTAPLWAISGLYLRLFQAGAAGSDTVQTLGDLWRQGEERFLRDRFPVVFIPTAYNPSQITLFSGMLMGDPGLVLPARLDAAPRQHAAQRHDLRIVDNYPNPFNASTNIIFDLPNDGQTTLRIFDITGREAARLVDGFQSHGEHTVQWNAAAHASGIYFVALQSAGKQHVRKITLLK